MKWAQRECADITIKALSPLKIGAYTFRAGEPFLFLDTATTSNIEVASTTTYVTGGRGNARQLSFQGDKTTTFTFTDCMMTNEGLALLSGADLIPARNKNLQGASPDARAVIAPVYKEKYSISTPNIADPRLHNVFTDDPSLYLNPMGNVLDYSPRGGIENVWLKNKPYVGQNSSIYVFLLDGAGEKAGRGIQINLETIGLTDIEKTAIANGTATDIVIQKSDRSYLAKFNGAVTGAIEWFVAFDANGLPMPIDPGNYIGNGTTNPNKNNLTRSNNIYPELPLAVGTIDDIKAAQAAFDDQVSHYVYVGTGTTPSTAPTAPGWWNLLYSSFDFEDYARELSAINYGEGFGESGYGYLLAPSGGIAQPKAFKEGTEFVYKVNVPSILYQDIVLIDYYQEHQHNATQISILPDKFSEYVYIEGFTTVRRKADGKDLAAVFVIPKFLITTQITLTFTSTGDAATFDFTGDAYPAFSKFDLTREVLADILILDADNNQSVSTDGGDPTSYRRYNYKDGDESFIWADPSIEAHSNLNYADTGSYLSTDGGPATITPGMGVIDQDPPDTIPAPPGP